MEKSINELIQLESSSKIPVLYNLPQIELARIVADWLGESFDPRNFDKYLRCYNEARSRFTEARRLDDLRKEEERLKKDSELGDKILHILKDHLVAEDHTGRIFQLDQDYEFAPMEEHGTMLHYRDGGPVIDPLPQLSCKFRGQKYKIKDMFKPHLSALVQEVNSGHLSLSVVALSAKFLAETFTFRCSIVQQSDCINWRSALRCGSTVLRIKAK